MRIKITGEPPCSLKPTNNPIGRKPTYNPNGHKLGLGARLWEHQEEQTGVDGRLMCVKMRGHTESQPWLLPWMNASAWSLTIDANSAFAMAKRNCGIIWKTKMQFQNHKPPSSQTPDPRQMRNCFRWIKFHALLSLSGYSNRLNTFNSAKPAF